MDGNFYLFSWRKRRWSQLPLATLLGKGGGHLSFGGTVALSWLPYKERHLLQRDEAKTRRFDWITA